MSPQSADPFALENLPHNPMVEEVVSILNTRTQNPEKSFFRIVTAFFLSKMAASMRVTIMTKDRGAIPVNCYAVALATSGYGKGHSVNILENEFMEGFRNRLVDSTIPNYSLIALSELASKRSAITGTSEAEELETVKAEYESGGVIPFTFDSGTVPAVKQLRQTLLMGRIGAVNLQIDEIASNLLSSTELLNMFLELYDQGLIKQKLTKNTNENKRRQELAGKTPANLLMFGTPAKLFDGGSIEDAFTEFLDIGYARRSLFAMGVSHTHNEERSASDIYHELVAANVDANMEKWVTTFTELASEDKVNWQILLEDSEGIKLVEYRIRCETLASKLSDTDFIGKAELSHRYFKVLKLAGTLAFCQSETILTESTLLQAIRIVEESGQAFQVMRTRDKPFVRLAKHIINDGSQLTHADLVDALPFYKTSAAARNDMMTLASAWAYSNHSVLTRTSVDGIDMFQGETLQQTDLQKIVVSYSTDYATGYIPAEAPFEKLTQLAQTPDIHWANHHFKSQHRQEANVLQGFNLIVLDVDGGIQADFVAKLLKEYMFIIYTTKRSTPEDNRFRILLPTSHYLKLSADDYRDFMSLLLRWLPFKLDEGANQRSRKWLSNPTGSIITNFSGEPIDVMPFIPRTSKATQASKKVASMSQLEQWFLNQVDNLGRNNMLSRYGMAVIDSGKTDLLAVQEAVLALNALLPTPLSEKEIESTIFITLTRKLQN